MISPNKTNYYLHLLPPVWQQKLVGLENQDFFKKLFRFLESESNQGKTIYPARSQILRALQFVDLPKVKVVILGQDPYHGPGQANGFSFAVPNDLKSKPPSLQNIFKELKSDLGIEIPKNQSDLSGWVDQGVLLLNTVLTVEAGAPLSHRNQGWERFTEQVIGILNAREVPVIFVLWGNQAQKVKAKINLKKHLVFESAHPSPLSAHRGFFGSKVFSKINEALKTLGVEPIKWEVASNNF